MTRLGNHLQLAMTALLLATNAIGGELSNKSLLKLGSKNITERRAAMREAAIAAPEDAGDEILPYIRAGLADSDQEVRSHAAAAAYRIATLSYFASKSRDGKVYGKPINIHLDADKALKDSLIKATSDNSAEVREYSFSALAFGFAKSNEIEKHLASHFKSEQSSRVRGAIIKGLAERGYSSSESAEAVLTALDDEHPDVRATAAIAIVRTHRTEALPKLAQGLENRDSFTLVRYVEALKSFGAEAQPYIPVIEKAMATSDDLKVKTSLQDAVLEIRANKKSAPR